MGAAQTCAKRKPPNPKAKDTSMDDIPNSTSGWTQTSSPRMLQTNEGPDQLSTTIATPPTKVRPQPVVIPINHNLRPPFQTPTTINNTTTTTAKLSTTPTALPVDPSLSSPPADGAAAASSSNPILQSPSLAPPTPAQSHIESHSTFMKPLPTTIRATDEKQIRQARQTQIQSIMMQKLSTDVDAQYLCYQPYLLLSDIIHLYCICHLWCHWIRSRGSAAHRFRGHLKNIGCTVTVRNSDELAQVIHAPCIQRYLYGCRIMPWGDQSPNSWLIHIVSDPTAKSQMKFQTAPPLLPLLAQLAKLNQIQHLTLDHVHPKEITRRGIHAYFTTVAPTLRTLELFPTSIPLTRLQETFGVKLSIGEYVTVNYYFMEKVHLLINLEELRITIRDGFNWSHLDQLPSLPHLHTFICKNEILYSKVGDQFAVSLGKCIHLKHCSLGHFQMDDAGSKAGIANIMTFLLTRHQTRQSLVEMIEGDFSHLPPDPLEYLDLSSTRIRPELWKFLTQYAPSLTILTGYWYLLPNDWPLLTRFWQLKTLDLMMAVPIGVNEFLNDLIQCPTIEVLTLGNIETPLSEVHLRSILSNLPRLTDFTLAITSLYNVKGFSEPNQLRRLAFRCCRLVREPKPVDPLDIIAFPVHGITRVDSDKPSIRATLPSIPSLTHLTIRGESLRIGGKKVSENDAEVIALTRELFQRMPLLATSQLDRKTYKRTDLNLELDSATPTSGAPVSLTVTSSPQPVPVTIPAEPTVSQLQTPPTFQASRVSSLDDSKEIDWGQESEVKLLCDKMEFKSNAIGGGATPESPGSPLLSCFPLSASLPRGMTRNREEDEEFEFELDLS